MKNQQLREEVESALREGYKPSEILEALREDGYSDERIRMVLRQIKNDITQNQEYRQKEKEPENDQKRQEKEVVQNSNLGQTQSNSVEAGQSRRENQASQKETTPDGNNHSQEKETRPSFSKKDTMNGVDLTGSNYTLKQSLIRNKYLLIDSKDEVVLRAKQKLFHLKENIGFKNSDGDQVLKVQAENMMDVAGDYTLTDEISDEPIAIIEKNWSLLHHKWKVKEASSEEKLLAKISSRGGIDILRLVGGMIPYLPNFFQFIPHQYSIENGEGEEIGEIKGHLGIRDVYDINVESKNASQETLVASAVAIDALEGN